MCRLRQLVGFIIVVLSLTGCSAAQQASVQVVVDTDMGFDDVRALMLLVQEPRVDLLAVTVAGGGIARCPTGAANAKAILDRLGEPDVPVACGPRGPLEGFNLAPTEWRDAADALAGMNLQPSSDFGQNTAAQLLVDTIGNAPEPVVVLTLGPLTNLAVAIDSTPGLVDNIERVVVMGGAFEVGGNTLSFATRPVAEFNIWFDPVAAERVLSAEVDITLIPLDATNDVPVTPLLYDVIAATDGTTPVATQLMGDYLAANPFTGGIYHWDDLAAATLVEPGLVVTEERRVAIRTDPGPANGQTADDRGGRLVTVAVGAERFAFEQYFADMFGLASLDSSAFRADARVLFDGTECRYDGPDPLPKRLAVEVTNSSEVSVLGVTAGVYDAGTTAEQLRAYESSNPTRPPGFLTLSAVAPLPAATTSYWVFENEDNTTLSCAYDIGSGLELAGPKLIADS